MRHVDIVKNEWLAGFKVVVARVHLERGQLKVDSNEVIWEKIVRRPLWDAPTGEMVGPDQARRFLELLPYSMRGDYLFATGLHEESECPFPEIARRVGV